MRLPLLCSMPLQADLTALASGHHAAAQFTARPGSEGEAFGPAIAGASRASEPVRAVSAMLREAIRLLEHPEVRSRNSANRQCSILRHVHGA